MARSRSRKIAAAGCRPRMRQKSRCATRALVTIGEGLVPSMIQLVRLPVSNPPLRINPVLQSGGVGVGVGFAVWARQIVQHRITIVVVNDDDVCLGRASPCP